MGKAWKIGVGVFGFGFAVATLFAFVIYGRQNAIAAAYDVNRFGELARHLASGEGFSLGAGLTMRRAPLYPGIVAVLLKIFGNVGTEAEIYRPVFLLQCGIVGLTCVTVWAIGCRLFEARTGLFAGLMTPLLPQTLRYVSSVEVETLMGLLIALTALMGLNFYRKPVLSSGLLFALVCAASVLTKPIGLFYPFVFFVLLWLRHRKPEPRKTLSVIALSLTAYLLCLLPWSMRNSLVSEGKFRGISTNAPGEFLRGYVLAQPKFYLLKQDFGGTSNEGLMWDLEANDTEQALLKPYGVPFYVPGQEADRKPMPASIGYELAKDGAESRIAKDKVFHHPVEFLQKFIVQTCTFWFIVETKKKSVAIGGMALLLLFGAGLGVRRAHRKGREALPVVAVLLYFHLTYAVILAFARYSFPLYPTLLVFAVAALVKKSPLVEHTE